MVKLLQEIWATYGDKFWLYCPACNAGWYFDSIKHTKHRKHAANKPLIMVQKCWRCTQPMAKLVITYDKEYPNAAR